MVADRFAVGDHRRVAAQRAASALVAADPSLLDEPDLEPVRPQLRQWSRILPHLLSDEAEAAISRRTQPIVAEALANLRALDDAAATAMAAADLALRGLDQPEPAARLAADLEAHRITDARAPVVAEALLSLAVSHALDDAQRGIADWRFRFALMEGTTVATLRRLLAAVRDAWPVAQTWHVRRAALVGGQFSDRRAGLPCGAATLEADALSGGEALAAYSEALAAASAEAAVRIVPGALNKVVLEADGRISATVLHRPTCRGRLMVAHELGHTVHALQAMRVRHTDPPGALVGETVACLTAMIAGRAQLGRHPDARAMALALGDTMVEELFVSAVISEFEDAVAQRVRANQSLDVPALNELWLAAHSAFYGHDVQVPAAVGSGWARLPGLATDPGRAIAYVWATVLAQALLATHPTDAAGVVSAAIEQGGVDADTFVVLLGLDPDGWIDAGIGALCTDLERLAQLVEPAGSPAGP